jgi:leader peptidase (prepilin peptidase)/N-methyltransferase
VNELPPGLRLALLAWAGVAGACVGSFLNVVVARVPAGESVVRPRSRCPRCRAPIAWYDNVPVVSWLLLRGRCRGCRAPISFRYPALELAVAFAAVLAVSRNGASSRALAELAFVALLVALAAIDLDTWLLPHALTWPVIALGLGASAAGAAAAPSFASSALGAAIGWGAFAAIAVFGEKVLKKEAMGWGDVWLVGGLGAFLGVGALLPVVLLASIQGAVVGVALLAVGRGETGERVRPSTSPALRAGSAPAERGRGGSAPEERGGDPDDDWVPPRHAVPFGPFLVAGALEWLWVGHLLARAVPALELFR